MRPKTIVYFERIIFGVLLLGVLQSYLGWDRAFARAVTLGQNSPVATLLTFIIFFFVLFGTLTLLVSRRRSKIAMWVLIAMFVIGLPPLVQQITREHDILTAIEVIAQVVAYSLLFTPSARRWMNREDEKLQDVFH
ncbi:MAG: hypothetical protein J2P54_04695 [Bradyrhizobiaceae bacterium]|nr:hypothetical protein [Bradyrhizobiaceae bacterium]